MIEVPLSKFSLTSVQGLPAVFLATPNVLKDAQQLFIAKLYESPSFDAHQNALSLLKQVSYFTSKYLVKPQLFAVDGLKIYAFMERMETSLAHVVASNRRNKRFFDAIEVSFIVRPLVQAVSYLHKEQMAHLNIAPSNLLLKDQLLFKLSDMCFLGKDRGAGHYKAPELSGQEHLVQVDQFKADVYSMGLLMLEVLTLLPIDQLQAVKQEDERKQAKLLEDWIHQDYKGLEAILLSMLRFEPGQREESSIVKSQILEWCRQVEAGSDGQTFAFVLTLIRNEHRVCI